MLLSEQYYLSGPDFGELSRVELAEVSRAAVDQVLADEVFNAAGQSTDTLWLLGDQQNTIRDIVDGNGVLRKHIDYDSYGNITGQDWYSKTGGPIFPIAPDAVDQLFYYTGREWDASTKLQNNRGRWYDPRMGRFLSEDPGGVTGDVHPNPFEYAGNDPIDNTDPTGLSLVSPLANLPSFNTTAFDLGYSNFQLGPKPKANSGVSLGTLGNIFGNTVYNTAASSVSPIARAAVGAGVSFVGASASLLPPFLLTVPPLGISDFFAGRAEAQARREQEYQYRLEQNVRQDAALSGFYGSSAFQEADARQNQQILHTELGGITPAGLMLANTRMENDFLQGVTGLTRTEAAVNLTKAVIRTTGQQIVQSDQWFASQPGIRYVENAVGVPFNPLTYVGLAAGGWRTLATLEEAGPAELSLAGETTLNDAPINAYYRAKLGTSTSTNYKSTFLNAYPELKGKVVVHHAVEQRVLTRYPAIMSESEMHSLENLRGIPTEINSRLHLSQIRREWDHFYMETPSPTKQDFLQKATQIDFKYGKQFNPPAGRILP